ncbi:MAG TPA: FxDxF family PEP-CTERM protein [Novosphingobium sp.]|nr:FxDxF family PEP-CTERM protein [Novosphingobium sp.]
MRRLIFTLAAAAAFTSAPAMATTFIPGSANFLVSGNIFAGPISASFGNAGSTAPNTTLQDIFQFIIPQNGVGSGSVTTGTTLALSATDTDLLSVLVNGTPATKTLSNGGLTETYSIAGVPITAGATNQIVVNYLSRGQFSYGGNATFNPVAAVPEPATWAMMLLGLGGIGFALRRRQRAAVKATGPRIGYKFA